MLNQHTRKRNLSDIDTTLVNKSGSSSKETVCTYIKQSPAGSIEDCTSWAVAQALDNCQLLADNNYITLDELLNYNPSLTMGGCLLIPGLSYCIEGSFGTDSAFVPPATAVDVDERALTSHNNKMPITPRNSDIEVSQMVAYTDQLFVSEISPSPALVSIWNLRIPPLFSSISYADFGDYLRNSQAGQWYLQRSGNFALASYITCNLQLFNDKVAQRKGKPVVPFTCTCYGDLCCAESEDCSDTEELKRLERSLGLSEPAKLALEKSEKVTRAQGAAPLQPRATSDYKWSATAPNGQNTAAITIPSRYVHSQEFCGGVVHFAHLPGQWPAPRDIPKDDWMWQHVSALDLVDDCTMMWLKQYTYEDIERYLNENPSVGKTPENFVQVEHWVEKNFFAKFTHDVINQTLASGKPFTAARSIPPTLFSEFMTVNLLSLQDEKTVPGAGAELMPKKRIMHTLGTKKYTENFLLLQGDVNNFKEGILKGDNPVALKKMAKFMDKEERVFLTKLREVFGVISYLNDADALKRGERTIERIRWEWYVYQKTYKAFDTSEESIDVVAAWDVWYKDYMQTRALAAKEFIKVWCQKGVEHWTSPSVAIREEAETVVKVLELYRKAAEKLAGFDTLKYPTGTPTPPGEDSDSDEEMED
ncbi:Killer toxin subunits alpha/beta 4 [Colletotrichum plurivorum]|uniref:Killer toxin subunits alpha/beta 4 n=1 Tax=Colletotrichum plurivorum TaxID=2175906 RepID=A0A8H6NRH1_9PEZI|nr:Killer toxin subunits alpha/beta 4 [Colletotrichum plurivorum]